MEEENYQLFKMQLEEYGIVNQEDIEYYYDKYSKGELDINTLGDTNYEDIYIDNASDFIWSNNRINAPFDQIFNNNAQERINTPFDQIFNNNAQRQERIMNPFDQIFNNNVQRQERIINNERITPSDFFQRFSRVFNDSSLNNNEENASNNFFQRFERVFTNVNPSNNNNDIPRNNFFQRFDNLNDENLQYDQNNQNNNVNNIGNLIAHVLNEINDNNFANVSNMSTIGSFFNIDNVVNFNDLDQIPKVMTENDMKEYDKNILSYNDLNNIKDRNIYLDGTCTICMENIKPNENECDEKIYVLLPCDHVFHHDCIMEWFKKYNYTCPNCKKECGTYEMKF
jgi:hypothetical protein